MAEPSIRFATIGLNHSHIYGQVDLLLQASAELVSFFAREPDLSARFAQAYPQARPAPAVGEILKDETLQFIVSAAISDERAPLGRPIAPMASRDTYPCTSQGVVSVSWSRCSSLRG